MRNVIFFYRLLYPTPNSQTLIMQTFLIDLAFIIMAYLMGSIPFGLLIAKYAGIGDIRQQGSGNIGATNVLRMGGKKLGIITLIFDALKGFIPVFMAKKFGSDWGVALAAMAAVAGHIFPVWLGFKGGKGVATSLAVYAAMVPGIFIVSGLAWLGVFYLSRISSLSSIISMVVAVIFSMFFMSGNVIFAIFTISCVVIYKHKENIIRLLRSEEPVFSSKGQG